MREGGRGMRGRTGYRFAVPALAVLLSLVACLFPGRTADAAVRIEKVNYKGWAGSYRMTNGTVEVVIVPAVARIMRYGFVGGPNLLWENPKALGKPAKPGDWPNFGGDKAWPWPQDDWPKHIGKGWPPPAAADQMPHAAFVLGDTVRLASRPLTEYGITIVRDITLSPTGTQVRIRTRFEKSKLRHKDAPGAQSMPVSVWVITQVKVPQTLAARLIPGTEMKLPPRYKLLMENPWQSIKVDRGVLLAERPAERNAKLGTDADLLAAAIGDTLFTVRSRTTHLPLSAFVPGERAQLYTNPAPDAYVELEFTGPVKKLAPGQSLTLEVIWQARRLTRTQRSAAAVADLVRGM